MIHYFLRVVSKKTDCLILPLNVDDKMANIENAILLGFKEEGDKSILHYVTNPYGQKEEGKPVELDPKKPLTLEWVYRWQGVDTPYKATLSLVPFNKGKYIRVKKKDTSRRGKRELEEFYALIGGHEKEIEEIGRESIISPWNPTSGMDPDLRAEYSGRPDDKEK